MNNNSQSKSREANIVPKLWCVKRVNALGNHASSSDDHQIATTTTINILHFKQSAVNILVVRNPLDKTISKN